MVGSFTLILDGCTQVNPLMMGSGCGRIPLVGYGRSRTSIHFFFPTTAVHGYTFMGIITRRDCSMITQGANGLQLVMFAKLKS